jgi:hypothetical protein
VLERLIYGLTGSYTSFRYSLPPIAFIIIAAPSPSLQKPACYSRYAVTTLKLHLF